MALASAKQSQPSRPAAAAVVVTVYRALDGGIHHARCMKRMTYRASAAVGELEFHCATCDERVMLSFTVAARLPITMSDAA